MSSPLARVPIERRRRLAATLALFAALFVAVGAVATTGESPGLVRVFAGVAFLVALLLGLAAWGTAHSTKIDVASRQLQGAIDAVIAGAGPGATCGCGHDHDPSEMHVTDAPGRDSGGLPAEQDAVCGQGTGVECTRDCDTCALVAMRPSPTRNRAERFG